MVDLTQQVALLEGSVPQSTGPLASTGTSLQNPNFNICDPEQGDLDKCRGFLLQYPLVFRQKAQFFTSDFSKVSHLVDLLRGKALAWAQALSSHRRLEAMSSMRLLSLRQGDPQ